MAMKASEKSIGVCSRTRPPHTVPSQLKIFTPVGTAMIIVATPKPASAIGPIPDVNMWWDHTPKPMNPIATPENTTNG